MKKSVKIFWSKDLVCDKPFDFLVAICLPRHTFTIFYKQKNMKFKTLRSKTIIQ